MPGSPRPRPPAVGLLLAASPGLVSRGCLRSEVSSAPPPARWEAGGGRFGFGDPRVKSARTHRPMDKRSAFAAPPDWRISWMGGSRGGAWGFAALKRPGAALAAHPLTSAMSGVGPAEASEERSFLRSAGRRIGREGPGTKEGRAGPGSGRLGSAGTRPSRLCWREPAAADGSRAPLPGKPHPRRRPLLNIHEHLCRPRALRSLWGSTLLALPVQGRSSAARATARPDLGSGASLGGARGWGGEAGDAAVLRSRSPRAPPRSWESRLLRARPGEQSALWPGS